MERHMPPAPIPVTETERLAALRSYDVLDTACEHAFDNIAQLAAQLTGTPMSLVSLIDAERAFFKARHGLDAVEAPRDHAFCAYAILNPTEAMVVPDTRLDSRFADNPFVTGAPDIRFYAGIPLVNPEGAALGTLCVLDHRPREMDQAQRQNLARLAETAMTTLELRRAMARVRRLALVDALTGLPNRPALMDALERALARQQRHGENFALLYLDLDGFKRINDQRGHMTGDAVLREVATALTASLREEDLGARLGGDEFAAVLAGNPLDVQAVAERVRGEIAAGMAAHGWAVTASVGAVSFRASPGSVNNALQAADAAMYRAKAAGKNRVAHHDHGLLPVQH
jgi:diguanylate cyclase (GGDEF)-like protein